MTPQTRAHTFEIASEKLFLRSYVQDADAFSLETSDVYSPGGPYTVAVMEKNVSDGRLETDLGLGAVSRALYDRFSS